MSTHCCLAAWHDSFVWVTWLFCFLHVTWLVHECHMTHLDTGWQRCLGCLKLQVSFRKRANIYRAVLRKMTYKDKVSSENLPSCDSTETLECPRTAVWLCDMTHACERHDSSKHLECPRTAVLLRDMTHSYEWLPGLQVFAGVTRSSLFQEVDNFSTQITKQQHNTEQLTNLFVVGQRICMSF